VISQFLTMSATIELNPPEMLAFNLVDPSVAPKSILTVVNKGNQKIAFKVKTTKPRRYLVRPNQGLVDVGQSTEVTVILQQKDCEELIAARQAKLTPQINFWSKVQWFLIHFTSIPCLNPKRSKPTNFHPCGRLQTRNHSPIKSSSVNSSSESSKSKLLRPLHPYLLLLPPLPETQVCSMRCQP